MPDFVSLETGNICVASRPANTPRQACSLDCIAKLRFAFQPAPAGKTVTPGIRASRQAPFQPDFYRALHFPVITTSLPAPAGQQHFGAYLLYSIQKRKPAKPISLSFSYNFKSSPNLVQAFPSQSLSLLFSPSSQYTLPRWLRSGYT